MNRADELLSLLKTPTNPLHRPKVWRGEKLWGYRSVYLGENSSQWFLTYSQNLKPYHPFSKADVQELLSRGEIESEYPGEPAEDQSYILVGLPDNPNSLKR
jgi:hypothetical protein